MLNKDNATKFARKSVSNEAIIIDALSERGCDCKPYEDVFTFARWRAQGYSVRKGEHGIQLPVIYRQDDDTTEDAPRFARSYVFCRCQVEEMKRKPLALPSDAEVERERVNIARVNARKSERVAMSERTRSARRST